MRGRFQVNYDDLPDNGVFDCEIGYPKTELNPDRQPLAYQHRFHNSKAKYRLMSGGFGTGGTTALAVEMAYQLLTYPNNVGLLGRHNSIELESTTLSEFLDILPKHNGQHLTIKQHDKQKKIIYFWNGSKLVYMGLDDSKGAVDKIKSLNLGFACIDQLEEIGEDIFLALQGRLRRQGTERCFFAKCNPEGHNWAWTRWVKQPFKEYLQAQKIPQNAGRKAVKLLLEAQVSRKLVDTVASTIADKMGLETTQVLSIYQKHQYEYFGAVTMDNIYLPPEYINNLLANYPKKWLERYVYNSWDNFEGLVYGEFKTRNNVETAYIPNDNDDHTFVYDYGFRNPACILFIAVDYDGVVHIYDEYYEREKLISDHAKFLKMNRYWKKANYIADPSIKKAERDGGSVYDTWMDDHDIWWEDADNDVRQGVDRVNEYLKQGRIKISKRCVNLLEEIQKYKWKQLKVGEEKNEYEEPVKKDDHAMDALRYFINHIYTPLQQDTESVARSFAIDLYEEGEDSYDETSM